MHESILENKRIYMLTSKIKETNGCKTLTTGLKQLKLALIQEKQKQIWVK